MFDWFHLIVRNYQAVCRHASATHELFVTIQVCYLWVVEREVLYLQSLLYYFLVLFFPSFFRRTHGGVQVCEKEATAPTLMWVKALDILLDKLRIEGVNFEHVQGISGTAQVRQTQIIECFQELPNYSTYMAWILKRSLQWNFKKGPNILTDLIRFVE